MQAPFKLTVLRNEYIHALVVFFDVQFSRCHKPLRIDTSPRCPAAVRPAAVHPQLPACCLPALGAELTTGLQGAPHALEADCPVPGGHPDGVQRGGHRRHGCARQLGPPCSCCLAAGLTPTAAGVLACTPNANNPRDLDIELDYAFTGAHGSWERHQSFRMR